MKRENKNSFKINQIYSFCIKEYKEKIIIIIRDKINSFD
jgi:hypothetical protein